MKRIAAGLMTTAGVLLALGGATAQAADSCANAAYRKGPGANLPDCRAWEQATPTNKGGVPPTDTPAFASLDGNQIMYAADANLGNGPGSSPYKNVFSSARNSDWSLVKIDPIGDFVQDPNFLFGQITEGISQDGTKALVMSTYDLAAGGTDGATNFYLRDLRTGGLTFAGSTPGRDTYNTFSNPGNLIFYDASPDFSHVVIALDGLTDLSGGRMTKVAVDSQGADVPFAGVGASRASTKVAAQSEVSQDGRRVTFVGASYAGRPGLFQRLDGTSTALISKSRQPGADPDVGIDVAAPGAYPSADGTRVFFAAANGAAPLTTSGPGPLYRWDANGTDGTLTDLLAGASPAVPSTAGQFRIFNVSADGRYVWFSYVLNSTQEGRSALLDTATKQITPLANAAFNEDNVWASPDGTKLVALSAVSLTGYDQACDGTPCAEAFLFDAKQPSGPPVCVSCGPAGTRSVSSARLGPVNSSYPVPRSWAVTDGGRVVFDTAQRLARADSNSVLDVYQYTPGQGTTLISSGASLMPSGLVAQSASGNDVFFMTSESLVAQDDDFDTDIYDARVHGGIASQQVARSSGVTCPSGNCPSAQTPAPPADAPPTASFQAPPRTPRFSVARMSAAARRSAAVSGRLEVSVSVNAAGKLSARAASRVGRRTTTVGSTSSFARRAGRVKLTLQLSRAARRALAGNRRLAVDLSVSYSRVAKASKQSFTLARPRSRSSARGGAR